MVAEAEEDASRAAVAIILAMGTANPASTVEQKDYPDMFFRVTGSEHLTELKSKFRRICERSGIQKRHLYLTEQLLERNKDLCSDSVRSSLPTRQLIARSEVAALGTQAARRAIQEWGQPVSKITHLVVATSNGIRMPGADLEIARELGLEADVRRLLLNQLGCSAGGTALRIARDMAAGYGGRGARVLVVCSEVGAFTFRPPSEKHPDQLVGSAVIADGAAAFVIGGDCGSGERGLFEMHTAEQLLVPDSEEELVAQLGEHGLVYSLTRNVPELVAGCLHEELVRKKRLLPLASDAIKMQELFWAVHPGGRAVLDAIESKLELQEQAMAASRETLRSFGNMASCAVMFVLDQLRRRPDCCADRQWGVLLSYGPGLTIEMQLLRALR